MIQSKEGRMANDINKLTDLQSFYDYCETNNIDPKIYTAALDDGNALDPSILTDPAFQHYWQLTYLKLMEILNPALIQSVYAETGEIDFDKVYARAGNTWNDAIQEMVLDSPELLGFGALTDNDPTTLNSEVMDELALYLKENGKDANDYIDSEARDMKDKLGLGGMYDWLIGTEEGMRSAENGVMAQIADMNELYAELSKGIQDGTMSPDAANAQIQQLNASMQMATGMIQNIEKTLSSIVEQMTNMVKERNDGQMAIIRNVNVNG